MSESNGKLPPGVTFLFSEQEYFLPRLTQDDMERFHAWCNMRAVQEVRAMEPLVLAKEMTAEEYSVELETVRTRRDAGSYAFDEVGGREKIYTKDGMTYICWLAMKHANAKLTLADVRKITDSDNGRLLAEQYALANANPTHPSPETPPSDGNSTPS